MSFALFKIMFFIIFKTFFLSSTLLASNEQDCLNSSFYIKNISVDLTKESINKARFEAEQKAKLIGFSRLINRLIIKNKTLRIDRTEIFALVDYLKINKEANSDKRYLANFDICFNRSLVINFFRKNKFQYAETYREPIAVLPVFKGPRGLVSWDERDYWYSNWQNNLKLIDGLVKFKLAKGNFSLNRILTSNILLKPNKKFINKLINNENTNALILVVAEPILMTTGKTFLSTYVKLYNKNGELETTIYRNKIPLNKTSSFYNIDKTLLDDEILKIIRSIEINWKKNNLIDTSMNDVVDLIIPITSEISTKLQKELLFNDKSITVDSTSKFLDRGFINIENEIIFYNKKSQNRFENIERSSFKTLKKLKYDKNSIIIQKNISIWPNVIKKLERLPFVIEVSVISINKTKGRIKVKFMGNRKTFFQAAFEKKLNFKNFNDRQYILSN